MNFDKIKNIIKYTMGLPKSIYVNLRLLPLDKAIKLPIIVSHKTKCSSLKGEAEIYPLKTGIVRVGFGNVKTVDFMQERTILHIDGKIIFHGKCKIGKATKIQIGDDGILDIGKNFIVSAKSTIIANKKVKIGDNCNIAWDTLIMDTDFHAIFDKERNIINPDREITIGNSVWVGTKATIMKGTVIPDNTIIAANSVVANRYNNEYKILAGNPAKVIKEHFGWNN